MLSCQIFLLLLTVGWRFGEVSGGLEQRDDQGLDQMATASFVRLRNATGYNSTLERPSIGDAEVTTIRYENSNGFVPMKPEARTGMTLLEKYGYADNALDRNNVGEERLSLFIRNPESSGDVDKPVENDPFYSPDARIFLSLTKQFSNRRSSASKDSTDDFELLRINDDTPSVASYQNFYDSLTSGSGSGQNTNGRDAGAENSQPRFHEDRRLSDADNIGSMNAPRNEKQRDNYPPNYPGNTGAQDQKNSATGTSQYFSYPQSNADQNNGNSYVYRKPDNFNYNYQAKQQNPLNFQPNYDQRDHRSSQENAEKIGRPIEFNFRQKHSRQSNKMLGKQLNAAMRTKSSSSRTSNFENSPAQRNEKFKPSPRQEETIDYFEHEPLFNRDEESGHSFERNEEAREDFSEENYEYVEVTEKPKRYRKQRKRPSQSPGDSGRLPKEHRDSDEEESSSGKRKIRFRQKQRGHKSRGNIWPENDDESGEESIDAAVRSNANLGNRKQRGGGEQNRRPKDDRNGWSKVSPNVEISHSSGIEIGQVGKPNLVLPVKLNLVPFANFDHETALGNSQGFDISNAVLQNFVTATPITFNNIPTGVSQISNTPQHIFGQNVPKTLQTIQGQNSKVQSSVPEVIVGQNGFNNPLQTVLVPQQNYQTQLKLGQNLRNVFSINGQNSYAQNLAAQTAGFGLLQQQNSPVTNFLGNSPVVRNPVLIQNQNAAQSYRPSNGNQVQNNAQVNSPHPTPQTFQNYQQQTSNYNVQVDPRGLQGHSSPVNQNFYSPESFVTLPTTPTPNYPQIGQFDGTENHAKKNFASGSNGQFVASASLTVGEQNQNQMRPPIQDSFQQTFRNDNLLPGKIKTFNQIAEATPTTLNFNGQSGLGGQQFGRDHRTEQFAQASNAIAQTYKDQNQQILKVANEIFESTLERLKQLQNNQNSKPEKSGSQNSPGQSIGGSGRGSESQSQNSGVKNVEIFTQNAFNDPYENSNSFGGPSLTTQMPIFATTGFSASLRTPTLSTIGQQSSLNGYVNSITEIGANERDLKTSPATNSKPNSPDLRLSPVLFNPINFVPSPETLKSQNLLNSRYNARESPLQGLNLVPLIPGGNFYRNSHLAQSDLFSKPKLTADLQKYAHEMFKESLRTMYNSRKWNNDRKSPASESSGVTAASSSKGRDELHHFKFPAPDIKPSKQILEAHFTEPGANNADIRSPQKLRSQAQDLAEILKPEFNLPPPISFEPVRFYYKPNIRLSRPTIADLNHPDFKLESDLGGTDYIRDFLIPPKPNAFLSKSPFSDVAPKRRPRPKKPTSETGKGTFFGKPSTGIVETAASNVAHHSNYPFDSPNNDYPLNRPPFEQEDGDFDPDYQNSHAGSGGHNFQSRYPSLTTSNPLPEDFSKQNFSNYDFNHPRTHNLMGLLRKNKRLPAGRSQNYFENKDDETEVRLDDRKPQERSLTNVYDENSDDVEETETGLNSTQTQQS